MTRSLAKADLRGTAGSMNDFRNKYVAHQERELSGPEVARSALAKWAQGLHRIWGCR